MMVLPVCLTLVIRFQTRRLGTGSKPVVGSSKRRTCGSPIKETAVLSLRLVPPLQPEKREIGTPGMSAEIKISYGRTQPSISMNNADTDAQKGHSDPWRPRLTFCSVWMPCSGQSRRQRQCNSLNVFFWTSGVHGNQCCLSWCNASSPQFFVQLVLVFFHQQGFHQGVYGCLAAFGLHAFQTSEEVQGLLHRQIVKHRVQLRAVSHCPPNLHKQQTHMYTCVTPFMDNSRLASCVFFVNLKRVWFKGIVLDPVFFACWPNFSRQMLTCATPTGGSDKPVFYLWELFRHAILRFLLLVWASMAILILSNKKQKQIVWLV